MQSRPVLSIAAVIEYLKNTESAPEISEQKLSSTQTIKTIGNVRIQKDSDGNDILPDVMQYQILTNLVRKLRLDITSDINTQSIPEGTTLLMAAIKANEHILISILLDFGADPKICDKDGNNAFLHASEKGDGETLAELLTMIKVHEKTKKESTVDDDEKISDVAPSALHAPHQDLHQFEQKQKIIFSPTSVAKNTFNEEKSRLILDAEILTHRNNKNETAFKLIESYKKLTIQSMPPTPVAKTVLKSRRKLNQIEPAVNTDDITRFQTLVNELQQFNQDNGLTSPRRKLRQKAAPQTTEKKLEPSYTPDKAYEERLKKIQGHYMRLVTKKEPQLQEAYKTATMTLIDLKPAALREEIRLTDVRLGLSVPSTIPMELIPAEMPVCYIDQARIHSSMEVLKDYFAPITAPLPSSVQLQTLRRLLTLHVNRHYIKAAESLYTKLFSMSVATGEDIIAMHGLIEKVIVDLRNIREASTLKHKSSGLYFDSSYMRRLVFIQEQIQTTKIYQSQVTYRHGHPSINMTDLNGMDLTYAQNSMLSRSKTVDAEAMQHDAVTKTDKVESKGYKKFVLKQYKVNISEFRTNTRLFVNLKAARERIQLRSESVAPVVNPTSLPATTTNQCGTRALLALLKDYYAPQSAPLFSSMQSNWLRRILTCHAGRRYVHDAKKLYDSLIHSPLATVDDIMHVHAVIKAKVAEIRAQSHDVKYDNTINNSSYLRRLAYIQTTLESFDEYAVHRGKDEAGHDFSPEQYLQKLDIKYIMDGIIAAPAQMSAG